MKPDQPTLAPLGKRSIRSEVLDNLLSIEGRRTRLFSNAEAAIEDMNGTVIINSLHNSREKRRSFSTVERRTNHGLGAKTALSDFILGRHGRVWMLKLFSYMSWLDTYMRYS